MHSTRIPPLSLLLIVFFIYSSLLLLLLSQQLVNSHPHPLNHLQQEEQSTLLKLKNDWGNPSSFNDSWNPSTLPNHCNWTGIHCDDVDGFVNGIILQGMRIVKKIPPSICELKNLKDINLFSNFIPGEFPTYLYNCSKLEILILGDNDFQGLIPDDINQLSNLRVLYLGYNNFFGNIPPSIGRFPFLQRLEIHSNGFNGSFPREIGNLTNQSDLSNLEKLDLSSNSISGGFPTFLYNCSKLEILDLESNNFSGDIPASIGRFPFLQSLQLDSNGFNGSFPPEIGNLTNLEVLDMSFNMFLPSRIPPEFGKLKKLSELSMSETNLIGEIPETIADLSNLENLDLSDNNLNGTIPRDLFLLKNLTLMYLSNNKISGEIPGNLRMQQTNVMGKIPETEIADLSNLRELDLSNNNLNGTIPRDIFLLKNLITVNLSYNSLSGEIPSNLFLTKNLKNVYLLNNNLSGEIPSNIENFNLLRIDLSNNRLSGGIPTNISRWTSLRIFKASNNLLTGKIPMELTALTYLRTLALDGNRLSGGIPSTINSSVSLITLTLSRNQISGELPPEICLLPVLNILDLSENQISGELPYEIFNLRLFFLNLSSNKLTGKLPDLRDNLRYEESFLDNPGLCSSNQISNLKPCISTTSRTSSKLSPILLEVIVVVVVTAFLVSSILKFVIRKFCKRKPEQDLATWVMTSFHELHFTESNILSSLTENNQIGSGGAGKVYRVPIDHLGNSVAVKKIWSERNLDQRLEKQFEAEVQILGSIRHINILKLLCCISNKDIKLLVYEYMENGNLYEWLHENNGGLSTSNDDRFLDWPRRLRIAVEVAQGLSYMHNNCSPSIIHRDIKSSNILLGSDFKARIADFGLARTLTKQGEPNSASVIAGSFGYIAPEYAHTSKVNEKIDVYSFGVVLLELVTGKKANKGDEYRNLTQWAWSRFLEVESIDVLMDEGVREECYLAEMRMVFKLGIICTDTLPSSRPTMKEALQILQRHSHPHPHPTRGLPSSSPGIQREEE